MRIYGQDRMLLEILCCLIMALLTSCTELLPMFLDEPDSAVIPHHSSVTLPCRVSPSSAVVRWKFNGDFIDPREKNHGFKFNGTDLHIRKFKHRKDGNSNDGIYQCIAETDLGSVASRPARLSKAVLKRFQSREDLHLNVTEGHNVVLPCQPPISNPEATILYQVNKTIISESTEHYQILSSGSLMISNATQFDNGQYRCIAVNPLTNQNRTSNHVIFLHVLQPSQDFTQEATIIQTSTTVKVREGEEATLECAAVGSPLPNITWGKYGGKLPPKRHYFKYGNLHIVNITGDDEGTYLCRASNEIGEEKLKAMVLELLEPPTVSAETSHVSVNPGESIRLRCDVKGLPAPDVIWYHNAVPITNILRTDGGVTTHSINDIQLADAGIYQCMSSNEAGVDYSIIHVEVKGDNGPSDGSITSDDNDGKGTNGVSNGKKSRKKNGNSKSAGQRRKGKKRRKHRKKHGRKNRNRNNKAFSNDESTSKVKLVPPTAPDVTQLSDTSVKLNWTVPENDGLKITFFRIQYKAIKPKKGPWKTDDAEIRGDQRMYEVAGLKQDGTYKFRIAAVYSNNDNNAGPNSEKFKLKTAPSPELQRPEGRPVIVEVKPLKYRKLYALNIKWTYMPQRKSLIEGFFLYYKQYNANENFTKVTLKEAAIRTYLLMNLVPGTEYTIKMKCFNTAGQSEFSTQVVKRTLGGQLQDHPFTPIPNASGKDLGVPNDKDGNVRPTPSSSNKGLEPPTKNNTQTSSEMLYMILGIVLGVMMLFLIIFMFMCWWKQRLQRRMMDVMNDAARSKFQDSSQRIYADSLRKKYVNGGYGVNGTIPNGHVSNAYTRMNINVNPLSEIDANSISNGHAGHPQYQTTTFVPNGSVPSQHGGSDNNFNKINHTLADSLHSCEPQQCLNSPDSMGSGEAPACPPSPHSNHVPIGFNSDYNSDSQELCSNSTRSCEQLAEKSHDKKHKTGGDYAVRCSYDSSLPSDANGSGTYTGKHKRRRKRGQSRENSTRDQATNTDLSSNEGTLEFSTLNKTSSSSSITGRKTNSPSRTSPLETNQCKEFMQSCEGV